MKSYKIWLGLTCKWGVGGLTSDEFTKWGHLTSELNKHCPDCIEGEVCESCRNTGLKLTIHEQLILHNIEKALEENRSTVVN
jgi:hypothetical protein